MGPHCTSHSAVARTGERTGGQQITRTRVPGLTRHAPGAANSLTASQANDCGDGAAHQGNGLHRQDCPRPKAPAVRGHSLGRRCRWRCCLCICCCCCCCCSHCWLCCCSGCWRCCCLGRCRGGSCCPRLRLCMLGAPLAFGCLALGGGGRCTLFHSGCCRWSADFLCNNTCQLQAVLRALPARPGAHEDHSVGGRCQQQQPHFYREKHVVGGEALGAS